jgi:hypothetical protein
MFGNGFAAGGGGGLNIDPSIILNMMNGGMGGGGGPGHGFHQFHTAHHQGPGASPFGGAGFGGHSQFGGGNPFEAFGAGGAGGANRGPFGPGGRGQGFPPGSTPFGGFADAAGRGRGQGGFGM